MTTHLPFIVCVLIAVASIALTTFVWDLPLWLGVLAVVWAWLMATVFT